MKFVLEQSPDYGGEVEIRLRCGMMDERLAALVRRIQLYAFSITATREGRQYAIALEDVFYFESVEETTFVYCENAVYECGHRLYELEQQVAGTACVRVSKSCILNTGHVESVRPLMGAKMEARLVNGEKVLVNRHYVPAFKAKFGIGEAKP